MYYYMSCKYNMCANTYIHTIQARERERERERHYLLLFRCKRCLLKCGGFNHEINNSLY